MKKLWEDCDEDGRKAEKDGAYVGFADFGKLFDGRGRSHAVRDGVSDNRL